MNQGAHYSQDCWYYKRFGSRRTSLQMETISKQIRGALTGTSPRWPNQQRRPNLQAKPQPSHGVGKRRRRTWLANRWPATRQAVQRQNQEPTRSRFTLCSNSAILIPSIWQQHCPENTEPTRRVAPLPLRVTISSHTQRPPGQPRLLDNWCGWQIASLENRNRVFC